MKVIASAKPFSYIGMVSGDKSITHRAIMLLALAKGGGRIYNPLLSFDTEATMLAMNKLGARVINRGDYIEVAPIEKPQSAEIDCQNSGTTMRLLMGLICGLSVSATLTGDESLQKRPMKRVSDCLQKMGADISTTEGYPPVLIKGGSCNDIVNLHLSIPSAQVKSAILLYGLLKNNATVLTFDTQTRDHTECMLDFLGADIVMGSNKITLKKSQLFGKDITVCGDISSAAFLMVAAAIGGSVRLADVGLNPSRAGIFVALDMFGVKYKILNKRVAYGEPVGDIEVVKSVLKPVTLEGDLIANIIDEIPALAVLMAFTNGVSHVKNASELRIKESDRIKLIVSNLKKAGVETVENDDGFTVFGKGYVDGGEQTIVTDGDHRIAMAFSLLARFSRNGLNIDDLDCIGVSFAAFRNIFQL